MHPADTGRKLYRNCYNCALSMGQVYDISGRYSHLATPMEEDALKMKQCSRCKLALYCSERCHAYHWLLHESECRDWSKETSTKIYPPTFKWLIVNNLYRSSIRLARFAVQSLSKDDLAVLFGSSYDGSSYDGSSYDGSSYANTVIGHILTNDAIVKNDLQSVRFLLKHGAVDRFHIHRGNEPSSSEVVKLLHARVNHLTVEPDVAVWHLKNLLDPYTQRNAALEKELFETYVTEDLVHPDEFVNSLCCHLQQETLPAVAYFLGRHGMSLYLDTTYTATFEERCASMRVRNQARMGLAERQQLMYDSLEAGLNSIRDLIHLIVLYLDKHLAVSTDFTTTTASCASACV